MLDGCVCVCFCTTVRNFCSSFVLDLGLASIARGNLLLNLCDFWLKGLERKVAKGFCRKGGLKVCLQLAACGREKRGRGNRCGIYVSNCSCRRHAKPPPLSMACGALVFIYKEWERERESRRKRDGLKGTCCIKNTDLRQMRQWPRQFNLRNSTMGTAHSEVGEESMHD